MYRCNSSVLTAVIARQNAKSQSLAISLYLLRAHLYEHSQSYQQALGETAAPSIEIQSRESATTERTHTVANPGIGVEYRGQTVKDWLQALLKGKQPQAYLQTLPIHPTITYLFMLIWGKALGPLRQRNTVSGCQGSTNFRASSEAQNPITHSQSRMVVES